MAVRVIPAAATVIALLAIWLIAVPRAGHPGAALAVATLATIPPFLYQALQPMSDVPALAAWLLATRAGGASLASGPGWRRRGHRAGDPHPPEPRAARPGRDLAGRHPGCVRPRRRAPRPAHRPRSRRRRGGRGQRAGVPVRVASAVGLRPRVGALRRPVHPGEPPAVCRLAAGGRRLACARTSLPLAPWGSPCARYADAAWRPVMLMGALTGALYLVYQPFDSWTYLRFVLVVLALAPLGVAHLLGTLQRSRHARWTFPVAALLLLVVALPNLRLRAQLGVFNVRAREHRYQVAGAFVRDHLPSGAVIVAVQHSASAPYYSGRPVIRPDLLIARRLWRARDLGGARAPPPRLRARRRRACHAASALRRRRRGRARLAASRRGRSARRPPACGWMPTATPTWLAGASAPAPHRAAALARAFCASCSV